MAIQRVDTDTLSVGEVGAVDPRFAQMEKTQMLVNPHIDGLSSLSSAQNIDNTTGDTFEEILDLSDQIRKSKGEAPLDRRSPIRSLHALLVRIAELTEAHIFQRQEKNQEKKLETLEHVETISQWTRYQAGGHLATGAIYPFLTIVGALVGKEMSEVVKIVQPFVPSIAQGAQNAAESFKQHPQFEQSIYLQTASSERGAIEGLKSMPRELQQKLMQILRQELDAIRAASRG